MIGATFDSNIYVSALEYGGIASRLLGMARAGNFRVDASDEILDETIGVLRRKFSWDGYRLHFARMKLAKEVNVVTPVQRVQAITEDPDDNRILECALAANSDYIVTHDKDLLRRGSYAGISIVRAADFIELLSKR